MLGAAAEFVASKYGGAVADLETVESVGVAAAEVIRNDPERVFALLVNLSLNTIYVGFDQSVSSARGIVLASNGGSYQTDVEEDFTLPARSMFAVSTGANSNLFVLTVRRISKLLPGEV
tara:strand:+ start:1410 stop:1766 length:357 start_codon:yes stop_codon:yes gene_type:complete